MPGSLAMRPREGCRDSPGERVAGRCRGPTAVTPSSVRPPLEADGEARAAHGVAGKGAFGAVFLVFKKDTGMAMAVKKMKKKIGKQNSAPRATTRAAPRARDASSHTAPARGELRAALWASAL
eukprot:7218377-Prymnesium_polylepis.1